MERGPTKVEIVPSEAFTLLNEEMEHGDEVGFDDLEKALKDGLITRIEYENLEKRLKLQMESIKAGLTSAGIKMREDISRLENDAVTGLLKHEALNQRLEHLLSELNHPNKLERREPHLHAIMVFFMDLDNLKGWNNFSREAGDKALKTLVQSVQNVSHDGGAMFRRGDQSDEIIFILRIEREVSDDVLEKDVLNRVKSAANSGFVEVDGQKLPVTAAVGSLIIRPGDTRNASEILRDADKKQDEDKKTPGVKEARIKAAKARLI
ncbi:diguanylate cyclase [Candidatus Nomurabacteria bacterium]|nr:diguanylate cyclase [Candidatus Nomurabacteria bacterium]